MTNKGRPKRRLLHDSGGGARQEISTFFLPKPVFPVPLPTIQSIECSVDLYQNPEARGNLTQRIGVRLVVYIDDILILAETETLAREHTQALINLLETQGFNLHTRLAQTNDRISGNKNLVSLQRATNPRRKINKLPAEASKLKSVATPSARVSRPLGKMTSVSLAVQPGPLFTRMLQWDVAKALELGSQSYEPLSESAKEELIWWIEHLSKWNGKSLVQKHPDVMIESDAPLIGWQAHSNGM